MGKSHKMSDSEKKISRRQRDFACALMNSKTISEAAEKAKICERQVYRWLQDREFVSFIDGLQTAIYLQALAQLVNKAGQAVETILGIETTVVDPQVDAVKLRAALGHLKLINDHWQAEQVRAKLDELEDLIQAGGNDNFEVLEIHGNETDQNNSPPADGAGPGEAQD